MSKTFTLVDAEKAFRRNYERLYKQAAKGQNARLIQILCDRKQIDGKEWWYMGDLNDRLADEIGMPEPEHVMDMTKEDMIRYLRPALWGAEHRLIHDELIPNPPLPPDGRRMEIMERNFDVALVKMIYKLLPEEPRKLTQGDLMIEIFDDPIAEADASGPDRCVSP